MTSSSESDSVVILCMNLETVNLQLHKMNDTLNAESTLNICKMATVEDESSMHSSLTVYLLACPICERCFDNEGNCFEHFLDHFENSHNFLSDRSNLVLWFSNYFRIAPEELDTDELPQLKDENMNTLTKLNKEAENSIESGEMSYSCQMRSELLLSEEDIDVQMRVEVPTIDFQLKCPLCEKYFCREESCLIHIFTHVKELVTKRPLKKSSSFTQDPFDLVKKWMLVFFCSYSDHRILIEYNLYRQRLNSPLLSKILLSELEALKKCKFCEKPVTSVFDFLDNHHNCERIEATKPSICLLCNFKAPDMDILMLHFFSDHIFCYCGYRGGDFQSFIDHSKECAAKKNGIICPCCRVDNFVTIGAFRDHIEKTTKKNCGSIFKRNKWICMMCNSQSSPKDIFNHILSVHISCLCGYKNKDMKLFFKHTGKCDLKKTTLRCPICCVVKCSTEVQLKQHASRCLPWKKPDQKLEFIEVQAENLMDLHTLHREDDTLSLEIPSKRARFSFDLNCAYCTSH